MADTKEKEPKQARQADPGEAPEGQEPKAADVAPAEAPAAPKPKQKDKQKDKQKGKKPAEGKPAAPAEPEGPPPEPAPPPRLHDYYEQRVRPKLAQQFGLTNLHEIPKLVKIVLNVGMGDASKNPKALEAAVAELGAIARGPDVRVSGPVHQHRAAAHARLPRAADRQLRRPGELHDRHQGADDLPGDRLRQGRE